MWCVLKLLIQNLKVFAKFSLNLTRTKFLDSNSDSLSNFSIKNVSRIHFLWQPSFLRRHRKGNFDVSLVCFDIFSKTSFATRFLFKTILLENVMRCDTAESEPDTLNKSPLKHRRFPKMLIERRTRNEKFSSKTVSSTSLFSQIHYLQGNIKLPSLKILPCIFANFFFSKASFATEFGAIKTQFDLKTWCVVKMLIQHLRHFKKDHSKTDELWKCWLEDSLALKHLVQKNFYSSFFSHVHFN